MREERKNPKLPLFIQLIISFPARVLILLVGLYQLTLSPYVGRQCRFVPTCSVFFIEAVNRHGAIRGGLMGIRRICRCHPFSAGGFDPVP